MKEKLAKLKTLLPAKEFILTGSYVLAQYGLVNPDDVADIDIILVKPESTALDNVKAFMRDFPAKVTPKPDSQCIGIFMLDGTKVDVFIDDQFTEPTLTIDGIKHTTIPQIIKAKKQYGRIKDWMQCREMSRVFFKEEQFQTMLNNTWKESLKSQDRS